MMALAFKWHRRRISANEYAERMGVLDEENTKNKEYSFTVNAEDKKYMVSLSSNLQDAFTGRSKLQRAYDAAADIRKFEIDLFWKRAAFFWAFIVAIYTAYYHVLTTIYKSESDACTHYEHGKFPLIVLSALGLFFCFSWLLSSKGSKHWQENWEKHLDLLEDDITGPLYKTYLPGSYSESKIVISAGWVITVCAYGLLVYEFANMTKERLGGNGLLPFTLALMFALVVIIFLFGYSRLMLGNLSSEGETQFTVKKYGEVR